LVTEKFKAAGKVACNLLSFVPTHKDCDVTNHDRWGDELDKEPEVAVINAENLPHKFTDRLRLTEKRRPATPLRAKLDLAVFFLPVQVCATVDSALGQFTFESSVGFGRQLFWTPHQLEEFFVGFRLVRNGKVVYRHRSEYYFSGMVETTDSIAVEIRRYHQLSIATLASAPRTKPTK
jgi:hypothetical protein